jgi:hypothetical protein
MSWILVLYFTCGLGCGAPGSVALPQTYATQQECTAAGNVWLSPSANPTRTVASFSCGSGSGGGTTGQAPRKREYGVTAPGECAIGFSEETCRRRGLKYNPPRQN